MRIEFIRTPEKRRLVEQLKEQFGIEKLPYLLIESGKEKIRAYSGIVVKEEIKELGKSLNIEAIGLYFIRKEHDLRLSFDAPHLISEQITNKIVDINEKELNSWLHGIDLRIPAEKGTVIIRHKKDLVGSGKSTGEKILNHVPKEKRLKN